MPQRVQKPCSAIQRSPFIRIPRELNPKISFNWIFIVTVYPGANPAEIEKLAGFLADSTAIPWVRAHSVPEFVQFNHKPHIRAEVDSLMNPSGESLTLDAANHRIVWLQRARAFRGGGFVRDSFPFVDAAELTKAYDVRR